MEPNRVITAMASRGSQCERVDDHVVRCTKRYRQNEPYAVLYFDLHGELPATDDALLGFQEKYLAERFFTGPRHLRWNHYLIFVLSDKKWATVADSEIRRRIETDTTYARKVVLSERDFDDFVVRQQEILKEAPKAPDDPTLQWRQLLRKSGLEEVVYAKNRGPTVTAWIDGTWKPGRMAQEFDADETGVEDGKRIAQIKWDRFREWPLQKEFKFGAVNLVSGVNGSGKTSLLEAVEYFFCAETRRNGVPPPGHRDVKAVLWGDKAYTTLSHQPSERTRRDLRWFGAYFRSKNELVDNFNRYLFFNADAASHLENADGGKFVSDAIANIALGPAAMDFWGRLAEFHKEFESQAAQLERRLTRASAALQDAKQEVQRLKALALSSEKKLDALRKAMDRAGWRKQPRTVDDFEDQFLSTIVAVHEQAESFTELQPPITSLSAVKKERKDLSHRIDEVRIHHKTMLQARRSIEKIESTVEELDKQVGAGKRLKTYVEVGWISLEHQTSIVESQFQVGSNASEKLERSDASFTEDERSRSVRQLNAVVAHQLSEATATAAKQRNILNEQQRRLSIVEHILAEAVSLGQRLIAIDPNASQCPLCGQNFAPSALRDRIAERGSALPPPTAIASSSITSVSALDDFVQQQLKRSAALKSYSDFENMMRNAKRVSGAISLADLQRLEAEVRAELVGVQALRQQLRNQRSKLLAEGFTNEEFANLVDELCGGRAPETEEDGRRLIDKHLAKLKTRLEEEKGALKLQKAAEKSAEQQVELLLQRQIRKIDVGDAIQELREFQDLLEAVMDAASEVAGSVRIEESENLREKQRHIGMVYQIANEISETISTERARIATVTQAEERLRNLAADEKALAAKRDRAKEATEAFNHLFRTLSLDRVAARYVDANRARISNILNAIHAPKEFSGIAPLKEDGENLSLRLIRRNGGAPAEISQISAGQRAAVALSVFLALNEKVMRGPPIIMMDDPVAHVDDLNVLAFLDALREIVVAGSRQLFFATANKKVAGIFEQKFSAFGEDFKNIALQRG